MKPIQTMTEQELDREIVQRLALLTESEKEAVISLLLKYVAGQEASASAPR